MRSCKVELQMPQTAKAWSPEDDLGDFLRTSGAYLNMKVRFDEGQSDEVYAAQILDFFEKVYGLSADVTLSIYAGEEYIYWEKLAVLADPPPPLPTKEEVLEDMEIARMML